MEKYIFSPEEHSLLESMPQPFAVYQFLDEQVVTLVLSDGFLELFRYEDRAKAYYDMDHDMYKYDHPDDVARIIEAALRFAREESGYDVIYRTKNRYGSGYRVVHATGKHVYKSSGVRLAYVWYADEGIYTEDADSRRNDFSRSLYDALHEESLIKASHYDYLTGLPSMTSFFELAEAGKKSIRKEGGWAVFLFIDLSGMKFFNHKNGFAEGDRYLQSFANLLKKFFGNDNCCRLGQDHFGVYTAEEGIEDRLQALFEENEKLNGGNSLPLRVGIYQTRMKDVPVSSACDRAKLACDAVRGVYQSHYNYFSQELRDDMVAQQYILENLDKAIENRWIQVYYQPIIRAVNGRVCDEEALARWIDPEKGLLSPAEFIPYLEEADLIYKLDLCVLDQVLEKLKFQMEAGLDIVPHSVNLSRSDFYACDIVEEIRRRVDDAGIKREMITIEITESTLGRDFEFMKEKIECFQELGFPVWMDDFGSGYSSLDVLQSIKFNLLKFDMSFLQRLDEGDSGKIILTELMKMATSLGVDTICEGVETEEQVIFLQEIGCSKLQGFYYCRAIPLEQIMDRYKKGIQIGYENPEEANYFELMGRINLYDYSVIASEGDYAFHNYFNTLPMGIIEVKDDKTRFVRNNQSYRDFFKRYFHLDLSHEGSDFAKFSDAFMKTVVKTCCEQGLRAFYDEKMPDGSIIHSFARRIGINPVNGNIAVAIAVLSITEADEGTTYADIARALASDYYNIYYIDLETEHFIEYSSLVGGEELAEERHGDNFFESARRDTFTRIYEEDREPFLSVFTKENVIRELNEQGVFTTTYRLIDTGAPVYVNMKITRMRRDSNSIIMGISIVDSQMKQQELLEEARKERNTLARIMALNEDYLSLYTINPDTGRYVEYTTSDEYETLGFAKTGDDFFGQSIEDGKKVVYPDDLPEYLDRFSKEKILDDIRNKGAFKLQYRLVINGKARPVSLRIAPFREGDEEKLFAGVRAWRVRK